MKANIMAHIVAGFPDYDKSMAAAEGLVEGGAAYLEVQFPFSDPSADGPLIQQACTQALENGFKTSEGFDLVSSLTKGRDIPVYIMSYASIVYAAGIEEFCLKSKKAGAAGLIIPDLPFDYDEDLYKRALKHGLDCVPVIAPSTSQQRIDEISELRPAYIYTALRSGITGKMTTLGHESLEYLDALKKTGAKIIAGFGIQTAEQVKALAPHVHAMAVGSAFVQTTRSVMDEDRKTIKERLKTKTESLLSDCRY